MANPLARSTWFTKASPKFMVHVLSSQKLGALSVKSNFIWTLMGTVVYSASQFAILAYLARMHGVYEVGQYSLAYAVTAPVMMFAGLQLRAVQATDSEDEFLFGHYYALRLLSILIVMPIVVSLSFYSGDGTAETMSILMIGISKAIELFSDLFYGLEQRYERMDYVAYSMIMRSLLGFILFVLVMEVTKQLYLAIAGMSLVWLAVLAWDYSVSKALLQQVATHVFDGLRPLWERQKLFALTRLLLPLGLGVFLSSIIQNMPKYFIEHFHNTETLGLFAAISHIAIGLTLLSTTLGQAARPRLAVYRTTSAHNYYQLLQKLLFISLILGAGAIVGAVLVGKDFLRLLYGPDFISLDKAFIWLMFFFTFSSLRLIMHVAIQSLRIFFVQPITFAVGLVTITISGFILIPQYEVTGGAIALTIFSIVDFLLASLVFVIWGRKLLHRMAPEGN